MTALAGFWDLEGRFDAGARCQAMLCAMRDCGPDDVACAVFGPLALGRALFRLLPEDQADRQPLSGRGGGLALVADLRLDNRGELAESLGIPPADASALPDSAFLLAAAQRWEAEVPERLLGDFAFATFDAAGRRLTLVRDPLGQRPLFWARGPGFIAFASMPKGLHALPEIARRPDADAAAGFLALLPHGGEEGWFEGIRRVEPGHAVTIRPDGEQVRAWWRPRRHTLRLPRFDDYVDAYRAELDRAVRVRLRRAEGPLAAHLSGGWDSGAVAATAARLSPQEDILAYTSVPRLAGDDYGRRFADEGPLAGATAAMHPNIRHIRLPSTGASPLARLDEDALLFERPLFNLCNHVWLGQVRAAARQAGARVLLSGEIGNWTISAARVGLLSDYLREGRPIDAWQAASALVRRGSARWRGVLAASLGPWLPEALWRLLGPLSSDGAAGLRPALQPAMAERMAAERARFPADRRQDRFDLAMSAFRAMDFGEHRKGILAGWGIDKRDPTADVRLIEFCLSLPLDMVLDRTGRRPLARAALGDRLPPVVLDHHGKGYQGADWHSGLTADLPRLAALVEAIGTDPVAGRVVDASRLREMIAHWPRGDWQSPRVIASYRNLLLQAVSTGHFLLSAQRPLPAVATMPLEPSA